MYLNNSNFIKTDLFYKFNYYIPKRMNSYRIICPCGSDIKYTSLKCHIQTQKHNKMFKFHCFPKPETFMEKIVILDEMSSNMKDIEYIRLSELHMNDYNYWKKEHTNSERKWGYFGRNTDTVTIGFQDHKKLWKKYDLKLK